MATETLIRLYEDSRSGGVCRGCDATINWVKTIGEQWASYLAEVIPPEAPAVQVEECKRAFYAGAQGMFALVMEAVAPEDDDACGARLQGIEREMQDWLRLFKRREGLDA